MSALPWEILSSAGVVFASSARVLIELIRARTTRRALCEALKDAKPDQRPPIVMALAELLRRERAPQQRAYRAGRSARAALRQRAEGE